MTPATVSRKNIVVCDDNDDILEFLDAFLTGAGFHVTTVHGFTELTIALRTLTPDLLLLDIFMPECDGYWVADELQFRGYRLPIILMTAYDDPAVRLNAPVSGALEYFVKPLDPEILLTKICKSLGVKPGESNWNLKVTESPSEN